MLGKPKFMEKKKKKKKRLTKTVVHFLTFDDFVMDMFVLLSFFFFFLFLFSFNDEMVGWDEIAVGSWGS